jgi:phospholipid/cholesterol/gamma-HCH transport system permease protein
MPIGTQPHTPAEDVRSISTHVGEDGTVTLTVRGRLDSTTTGGIWREAAAVLDKTASARIVIDASGVDYCDGSGVGFLLHLRCRQHGEGKALEINGLRPEFRQLLDSFDPAEFEESPAQKPTRTNLPAEVGQAVYKAWEDVRTLVAFTGELCVALVSAARNPRQVRWKDAFLVAETAGVNAFPIVALISFLVGLIMAFQSAIPMRQFGADIFVADLVALSVVRELGPLMTAIILAGRSGSAFAAELGTMKVNEEIDALTTMGLDPVRFLVTSRVIAAVTTTPLLTVLANLLGIMGGCVVMLSLGYPLITYANRVASVLDLGDLLGGLVKAFVFGILVAGIGCLRGLQTKTGASAVGDPPLGQ